MRKISFVRDLMQMDPEIIDDTANRFAELVTGLSREKGFEPEEFMADALDRFCAGEAKYGVSFCETALWEEFANYIECAVIDEIDYIIKKDNLNLDTMDFSKFNELAHIDINENSLDLIKMSAVLLTDGTNFNYEVKEPKDLQLFVREMAQNIADVLQERDSVRNEVEKAVIQYLSENRNTADLLRMTDISLSDYMLMRPSDSAEYVYDKLAEAVRNMTDKELEEQYQNIDSSGSKSRRNEHELLEF